MVSGLGLASAQVAVTTYHNDLYRTGQNLSETILTPANVNSNSFGKLFSYAVDGYVYAQPLYLPNVTITGKGTHNVVFVATENDSVYAFDADTNSPPLWQVSFINPAAGVTTVPSSDVGTTDIVPQIGITGTPVIDAQRGTLFVVAKTKEVVDGSPRYFQRLHALDIASGAEKLGGPFVISGFYPGTCEVNVNGYVVFSPLRHHQRAGLALYGRLLYVAFASHGDNNPYTGWLMVFDAQTGTRLAVWNSAPDTGFPGECRGGIWQGGAAPAIDFTGKIYLATGNGYANAFSGGRDYSDSAVKLSLTSSGLNVVDYFTPYNQANLEGSDSDLGSGGVLLLPPQPGPNPQLLTAGGKEGKLYLIDRANMGKFRAGGDTQIVQTLNGVGAVFGIPAYFNRGVYVGGGFSGSMKLFKLTNGLFATTPASQTNTVFGFPGPTPSISANGSTNGIVWALQNDAYNSSGQAILHAYDAANLVTELYNSNQNAIRDQPGPAVKFTVPTVVNGKVYAGTANSLAVYGLLP